MNGQEMRALVEACTYKPGWSINLHLEQHHSHARPYIQIEVDETAEAARCPFTGKVEPWRGGKRYLSWHMCKQEVVGACLDAIKAAEMHEMHEWFKYRDRSIFNPHFDPDALWEIATLKHMNIRKNAMSMAE